MAYKNYFKVTSVTPEGVGKATVEASADNEGQVETVNIVATTGEFSVGEFVTVTVTPGQV